MSIVLSLLAAHTILSQSPATSGGFTGSTNWINGDSFVTGNYYGDISKCVGFPNIIVTQTNFISGKLYTNNTGRILYVQANVLLTGAAIAGTIEMDLKTGDGNTMNALSVVKRNTILLGLLVSDNFQIGAFIQTNTVYTFTNVSNGSGNSTSIIAGTGQIAQH